MSALRCLSCTVAKISRRQVGDPRRPRVLPPMGQQAMLARGIAIGHTGCEVELVVDRDCHVIPYELALPLLAHLGHELVDFLGEDARLPIDGLMLGKYRFVRVLSLACGTKHCA